jgi:hypothetical protein
MLMRFRFNRWLMWMAMAAAAMYFLDPERGEQRRKQMRSRFEGYRKVAEKTERDLKKASG